MEHLNLLHNLLNTTNAGYAWRFYVLSESDINLDILGMSNLLH